MSLYVKGKQINSPIIDILFKVRDETRLEGKDYLKDIKDRGKTLSITCPVHKNHSERKPSCGVFLEKVGTFNVGDFHCFTCQATGNLVKLVSLCFEETESFSEDWLAERYGDIVKRDYPYLEEIVLDNHNESKTDSFIDESVLNKFSYYHSYMEKRKITKFVSHLFNIGYDKENDAITFPVWNEDNKLVMITKRSVKTKRFYLEKSVAKPVYLLNYIKKWNIDTVIVTESQINCLTCYGYHLPAVALFGCGTSTQYEVLNRSGIKHYILCFDGDEAGRKGALRFKNNIRDDVIVDDIIIPNGEDVNSLNKESFIRLLKENDINLKYLEDLYFSKIIG